VEKTAYRNFFVPVCSGSPALGKTEKGKSPTSALETGTELMSN
jgi:hypothetical protein